MRVSLLLPLCSTRAFFLSRSAFEIRARYGESGGLVRFSRTVPVFAQTFTVRSFDTTRTGLSGVSKLMDGSLREVDLIREPARLVPDERSYRFVHVDLTLIITGAANSATL